MSTATATVTVPKFRVERDVFAVALAAPVTVTDPRRDPSGLTSGVTLSLAGDDLTITGTDGDRIHASSTVRVAGLADGAATVPGRTLTRILRAFEPGACEIAYAPSMKEQGRSTYLDDSRVTVASGRCEAALRIPNVDPVTAPEAGAPTWAAMSGALGEALVDVVRYAGTDPNRPIIATVAFQPHDDHLRLAATDSYTVRVVDLPDVPAPPEPFLLPESAATLIGDHALIDGCGDWRYDGTVVTVTDHRSSLGATTITVRPQPGEFPDYAGLPVPAVTATLTGRLDVLRDAVLDVAAIAGPSNATPVRIHASPKGVRLTWDGHDTAHLDWGDVAGVESDGTLMVAFNPEYLARVLSPTAVAVRLGTDRDAVYVEHADGHAMVMPVVVQ